VIIGQDPYHGPKQAEGLCFSVPQGIGIPSSLRNIYKELKSDLNTFKIPSHGHLIKWVKQGILLLNATLTVRAGAANSHESIGWQPFTDAIVQKFNTQPNPLVFILWGNFAQKKCNQVDSNKHTILKAAHPSDLSAHKGFFGCGHFSKCNAALVKYGSLPIDWQL